MSKYLITLQAPDRLGLVEQIADVIQQHSGNWLDSELRQFQGIFAAIISLEVKDNSWRGLREALESIDGLSLTYSSAPQLPIKKKQATYNLVAYDRPGLVNEISNLINGLGINIEQFSSRYESASHTGIALFRATISVNLADNRSEDKLQQALYTLGDDVVLDRLNK